jgi:hypothetical protein
MVPWNTRTLAVGLPRVVEVRSRAVGGGAHVVPGDGPAVVLDPGLPLADLAIGLNLGPEDRATIL